MSWYDQTRRLLSPECRRALHAAAEQFDTAWDSGNPPDIATLLPPIEPLRSCVLFELVRTDLEQRLASGETGTAGNYIQRFPELQREEEAQVELVVWEFRLTCPAGTTLGDVCSRYPRLADRLLKLLPPDAPRPSWCPPGYSLVATLDRGAMGEVLLVDQRDPQRRLALKVVSLLLTENREAVVRFQREADILKTLRHPNIVEVYDVGYHDRRHFYTMRFYSDGSLAKWLNGVPLPSRDVAEAVAAIASAIQHVHDHGVVHRDLKPSNVLLRAKPEASEGGQPKFTAGRTLSDFDPAVSDFGLADANTESSLTRTGQELGTPAYMAPEQAHGAPAAVGPAADIWALGGVILYQCLTGVCPFQAHTQKATLDQIRTQDPVPPRRHNPSLPRDLETICLRCLEKNPAGRYATAGDLADDLHRFLRGEPIQAKPIGPVVQTWRWFRSRVRQHPRRTALAAIAAILLVTVGIVGYMWVETARRIDEKLQGALVLLDQKKWADARSAANQADALLKNSWGHWGLGRRTREVLGDLDFVAQSEKIRLQQAGMSLPRERPRTATARSTGASVQPNLDGVVYFDVASADSEYVRAFQHYEIDVDGLEPGDVARRIHARAIRSELLKALYDWSMVRQNPRGREHLFAVIAAADSDEWRRQLREAIAERDRSVLLTLMAADGVLDQPAPSLEMLGLALADMGDREGAEAFLKLVRRRYPSDFWVNHQLAVLLRDLGKRSEAKTYYLIAQALLPESAPVNLNAGAILYMAGEYDDARAAFERAVHFDPNFAEGHENIGLTYLKQEAWDRAIAAFQAAVRVSPEFARAYYHLGLAYAEKGDLERSAAASRNALNVQPEFEDARHNLKTAYCNLGNRLRLTNPEEALKRYQQAIEVDPDYLEAHANLGLTFQQLERYNEALASLRRSHALLPPNDPRRVQSQKWISDCERLVENDRR